MFILSDKSFENIELYFWVKQEILLKYNLVRLGIIYYFDERNRELFVFMLGT